MAVHPLYRKIEFCSSAEALWGKLNSDRWDWLGVKPDGDFVLGSPPIGREMAKPIGIVQSSPTRPKGRHGVLVQEPMSPSSEWWFETGDEARAEFKGRVRALREDKEEPRVVRVKLLVHSVSADEEFIVHRPPTYG
jgi:hypothetical protein